MSGRGGRVDKRVAHAVLFKLQCDGNGDGDGDGNGDGNNDSNGAKNSDGNGRRQQW